MRFEIGDEDCAATCIRGTIGVNWDVVNDFVWIIPTGIVVSLIAVGTIFYFAVLRS